MAHVQHLRAQVVQHPTSAHGGGATSKAGLEGFATPNICSRRCFDFQLFSSTVVRRPALEGAAMSTI